MKRSLIIADDFTGANDTGLQLKRRGYPTKVVLRFKENEDQSSSYVVDTESRGLSEKEAFIKVRADVENIKFEDFDYIIKKIDSTLRGNVAEEIKAVDESYSNDLIVFMPALPDLNRTTINGIHLLNNIPITQTELAKDPKKPVIEDHIGKLLEAVYEEKITQITLQQIRNEKIDYNNGRIFICDAETNQDMKMVLRSTLELNRKILYVGTAAIVENLCEVEEVIKPSLGLIASISTTTIEQVKFAERAGISLVKVPIYKLLNGEKINRYIEEAVTLIIQGRDVIVLSTASYNRAEYEKTVECGIRLGLEKNEISDKAQEIMGKIGENIIDQVKISGVFLAGGDTAISLFEKLGACGTEIIEEVAIGIPLLQLIGGKYEGLKIITKAGAFGRNDAISYGLRKLKESI